MAADHVRQIQFFQDTPGEIIFRVVPKPTFSEHHAEFILKALKNRFGEKTLVNVERVSEINLTSQRKLKYLDQRLDLSTYDEPNCQE